MEGCGLLDSNISICSRHSTQRRPAFFFCGLLSIQLFNLYLCTCLLCRMNHKMVYQPCSEVSRSFQHGNCPFCPMCVSSGTLKFVLVLWNSFSVAISMYNKKIHGAFQVPKGVFCHQSFSNIINRFSSHELSQHLDSNLFTSRVHLDWMRTHCN